jgi:mycofactocin precursor
MESRLVQPAPAPELGTASVQPVARGTAGNLAGDRLHRKLDLNALEAPMKLAEARLEDFTIDGICGVY